MSAPYVGNGCAYLRSELVPDTDGRWIDPAGRGGYAPPWGGVWVCYTCGHSCECGDDD